jgi:histidinol-phosphate aminotransferase
MHKKIEDRFKLYFAEDNSYRGGKSGDPTQFDKIHKMSSNENPLGCSPHVHQAIADHHQSVSQYPDATDLNLRQVLAKHYDGKLQVDQIICGNGGSEIIDWLIKGFVNVGDQVIISSPFFVPYRSFSRWAGATAVDVPLLIDDNYAVDVDGIIAAIDDKTRIVFLTSPNNPSGSYINRAQFEALLERIPDDVIVAYDEVYHHFIDQADYPRAYEYIDRHPNLVGINSFSKAYGIAGMRIGYGYFSPQVASYLRLIVRPFIIPKLTLAAAIAAVEDQSWVEQTAAQNLRGRQYLYDQLSQMNIKVYESHGNFLMFKVPDHLAVFQALADQGIFIRPLDNYDAPGMLRVSVGTQDNNEAFVHAIRKIIE